MVTVHPDEMKRVPKCDKCGSKKGWRLEFQAKDPRETCNCNAVVGPHGGTFPHKTNHPMCDNSPQGILNQAKRAGVTDPNDLMDAAIESSGRLMKPDDDCPF